MVPRSDKTLVTSKLPQQPASSAPAVKLTPTVPAEVPSHPYAKAKDTNYLLPIDKNFTGKVHKRDYQTSTPVQNLKIAEEVYERTMKNASVTISYEELFSLSPEMRQKY